MTSVTKEEFISCMLNSPLLGESLRRIGNTDHVLHPKMAIPLTCHIMDPHQEEEDSQFMDAVNVGQSILVEVWDADVGSKDFLGEVWLPPLSSLTVQPKDYVLPLGKAEMDEDAENGPSRETKNKVLSDDKKITGELYVRLAWKYPIYDLPAGGAANGESESVKDRAETQEKLHTGRLTFEVLRARHLRRADAAKGRDCDPQVTAWVRNDVAKGEGDVPGRWRKKPLARTGVIRNNRNPKWQGEFKESPFEIMTGSYEARFPERLEGWFEEVKTVFRTNRMKRHIREDREMMAIKRFGTQGLRVQFTGTMAMNNPQGPPKPLEEGGDNHKVEVFMGDSIREFKAKITEACEKEAAFWAGKGDADKESRFKDVKISYKHLVMVFVPSAKVVMLAAQKLTEGTEYRHEYAKAQQDPNCWQPMDPTRTFGQYPQYGFGRAQPQMLRIVEATEAYKLVNLRYMEFDREQAKPFYKDTNESNKCFGWAKYWHQHDQKRFDALSSQAHASGAPNASKADNVTEERDWEWRPAFLHKDSSADPKGKEGAPVTYRVEWCCKPEISGGGAQINNRTLLDKDGRHEVDQSEILLNPRCPMIDAYVHPDHHDFLEQAKQLRQIGKSDWEIEVMLNKLINDKFPDDEKGQHVEKKPPPITVDIIRNYFQHKDAAEASKAGGRALKAPGDGGAPSKTR
jgi:hypothetical protein